MHESEAMKFIEIVFCKFLEEKYGHEKVSNEQAEKCLKKIKNFIRDDESYWVSVKAQYFIGELVNCDIELPQKFPQAIDILLERVKASVLEITGSSNSVSTKIRVEMPQFPVK